MPLSIRPLTLEDMPTYVSLNNLAFEATISRMLFESPLSAASSEVLHVKVLEALRDDKSSHFFMAVDDDAAEPVGCAHWLVHEEWRPPAKEGDEAAALEASAERLATLPEARNGGKVTRGFFRERLGRGKVLPEGKPRIGAWTVAGSSHTCRFSRHRQCLRVSGSLRGGTANAHG